MLVSSRFLFVVVCFFLQCHGKPIVIHGDGLELEAADAVPVVDLLLDDGIHRSAADVLVHRVIGEAQIVLVGQAGEAVGRRP